MDHKDHLDLIRKGVNAGEVWAEFGSGSGHFTLALADLLGASGVIFSIDKISHSLRSQEGRLKLHKGTHLLPEMHFLTKDYTLPLNLPSLNGALMANALHFQENKASVLERLLAYLQPGGRFLLVEYNTDRGNHWVPFPISFRTWDKLARQVGLEGTRLLHRVPSSFLGEVYAAVSYRK